MQAIKCLVKVGVTQEPNLGASIYISMLLTLVSVFSLCFQRTLGLYFQLSPEDLHSDVLKALQAQQVQNIINCHSPQSIPLPALLVSSNRLTDITSHLFSTGRKLSHLQLVTFNSEIALCCP